MHRTKSKEVRKVAEAEGINCRRLKKNIKPAASWRSTLPQNVPIFPKKRKPGESLFDLKARRKITNKRKRNGKEVKKYWFYIYG